MSLPPPPPPGPPQEEDEAIADATALILERVKIHAPPPEVFDEFEEEEEEEEEEKETWAQLHAFAKKQKTQPPRRVPYETLGVDAESAAAHNATVTRAAVYAIMAVGSRACSSYAAAEAGTTLVFRGSLYGTNTPPSEITQAIQKRNEMLGVHLDPYDCIMIEYRSIPLRESPGEVVFVDQTVEVSIFDLT